MCVDVELNMHTLEAQVRCFVGFGLLKMEEVKCVPMLIFYAYFGAQVLLFCSFSF